MVTPSLVMVGAPKLLLMTTLRPRGPRVTLTASASLSTPRSRARRASSSNRMILAIARPLSEGVRGADDDRPGTRCLGSPGRLKDPVLLTPRKLGASLWTGPTSLRWVL